MNIGTNDIEELRIELRNISRLAYAHGWNPEAGDSKVLIGFLQDALLERDDLRDKLSVTKDGKLRWSERIDLSKDELATELQLVDGGIGVFRFRGSGNCVLNLTLPFSTMRVIYKALEPWCK
jgi:hypothetical protein